ncbi:MAG: hypothetical protein JW731_13025 [Bacteroidales bacterium]|nr:hypothetical protein [Bacteroidales bacterium]
MNLQEIDRLTKKYDAGETTLKEEELLRAFLSRPNIPVKFRVYRELFGFYEAAKKEEIPDNNFDDKIIELIKTQDRKSISKAKLRSIFSMVALAASVVIIVGFYFYYQSNRNNLGTYSDPEIAYAKTKKILLAVSENLNTGTKELSNIKEFNNGITELYNISSFSDGMKSLEKISIMDKSKKIIQNKNLKK